MAINTAFKNRHLLTVSMLVAMFACQSTFNKSRIEKSHKEYDF